MCRLRYPVFPNLYDTGKCFWNLHLSLLPSAISEEIMDYFNLVNSVSDTLKSVCRIAVNILQCATNFTPVDKRLEQGALKA
jgi:hypothetical protein